MKHFYRERKFFCGNYLDVDIFPVRKTQSGGGKKAKPTPEAEAMLNEPNLIQQLTRLLNTNFSKDDIALHLTYLDDFLPKTPEKAMQDAWHFIKKIRKHRAKLGLSPLKYVFVPVGGINGSRYHFFMLMNGGIDRSLLEDLWSYGYASSQRLPFDENGLERLAEYIVWQFKKQTDDSTFKKHWSASRNLIDPTPRNRDDRISHRQAHEIAQLDKSTQEILERLYDGYRLSKVALVFNDENGMYYLRVRMCKKDCMVPRTIRPKKR